MNKEQLPSCTMCSPVTESTFCVENNGKRYRYMVHEDSAPMVFGSLISECPKRTNLEILQSFNKK